MLFNCAEQGGDDVADCHLDLCFDMLRCLVSTCNALGKGAHCCDAVVLDG